MVTMQTSRRFDQIKPSATIKLIERVNELKSAGVDIISFGAGEPDFSTPKHICEAAKEAMFEGFTHYTPSAGIPELREEIARKFREDNKLDVGPDDVIATPGAKHAIHEACMALLNEGDEVILFSPAWVSYEACINLAGGHTKWLHKTMENDISDLNLAEEISKKTKFILLNSPNNPAGYVLSREELREVCDIAIDHDIFVLSDEIYEKIIYGKEHICTASLDGMQERTVTINGFSKTYAMTGWRLGYATAPPEIMKDMIKLQQHSVSNVTSFVQKAGVSAMRAPQDCVDEMVNEFRRRRDAIVKGVRSIGFDCELPDGAFYLFVNAKNFGSSMELADRLLNDAHVAVTPGSAFGDDDYIRFSYATSMENIYEGLKRIETILG
jgi:aspartate aminotransferase